MKKLIVLCVCGLLLLSGCSDKYTAVSNGSEVLMQVNNKKYTKEDLYGMAQVSNSDTFVINEAKKVLNSGVEVTEAMKAEAETEYATAIKDKVEADVLKAAGYETKEAYIENLIYPTLKEKAVVKEYVRANYDSLASTNALKKVRIIEVKTEADGNAVIAKIKAGDSFESLIQTYNQSTTYTGAEVISTTNSGANAANILPTDVATVIASYTTPQLVENVINDSSTSKMFVIQVTAASPGLFVEDGITFLSGLSTVTTAYYEVKFKEAGFKVYDKGIYDAIKAGNYSTYLNQ